MASMPGTQEHANDQWLYVIDHQRVITAVSKSRDGTYFIICLTAALATASASSSEK
jgi:hypothetical protein